jgi:gamma-glutamyltranspeptidase
MALRDGRPSWCSGRWVATARCPIHVQLLRRLVDAGVDPQSAIDAPRFVVDVADGSVVVEAGRARRGGRGPPRPRSRGPVIEHRAHAAGHAHVLRVTGAGYEAGTDPRCEGAVTGG